MQDDSEVNSEIKATDGQTNFEVQCLVEPIVPPQAIVQWTRNGKVNNNTHWKSDHRSLALNFDRVEYNDAGEYKCMMELENHIERSIDFVGKYTSYFKPIIIIMSSVICSYFTC